MSKETDEKTEQPVVSDLVISFDELYAEHKAAVYSYTCYLTRNKTEAEDLFQETWLRVVKHLHRIKETEKTRAWLFTIAANLYKDLLRKKKIRISFWQKNNHSSSLDYRHFGAGKTDDPVEKTELKEAGKKIMQGLEKIPEKLRRVFVLREIEGFSYVEISNILKLPEGTVKSRLHRAIKRLQQELAYLKPWSGSGQRSVT